MSSYLGSRGPKRSRGKSINPAVKSSQCVFPQDGVHLKLLYFYLTVNKVKQEC